MLYVGGLNIFKPNCQFEVAGDPTLWLSDLNVWHTSCVSWMTVFSCPTFVASTYLIGGFGTCFFPMILGMSSSQLIHFFFFRGVGGSTTNQLCRYVLRPWSRRRVAKEKFWKWLWGAKNHGEQWWLLLSIGVGVKIFGIEYWGQPLLQCFLIQPQTNSVDWCHKHQSVKHVQLMLIEVGMSLHLSKRFSNYMIFRWENIVCSQTGVDV